MILPWVPLELAYDATLLVDWSQTLYIQQHPGQFYERNPLMGPHPVSRAVVNRYFAASALTHLGASFALGNWPKTRAAFQVTTIAFEVSVINSNKSIGIRLGF